jgi:acyl-CoA thioester hydrolase
MTKEIDLSAPIPVAEAKFVDAGKSRHPLLGNFPVVIVLPVQWGDQDAFGHVNNTVPFRWFESARIAYSQRIGLFELFQANQVGPILAAASCNYRRQVTFPDRVQVGIRVVRIGRTSLGMEQSAVSDEQGAIVAEGASTSVMFDYRANEKRLVPASIRRAIETLEGRAFESR